MQEIKIAKRARLQGLDLKPFQRQLIQDMVSSRSKKLLVAYPPGTGKTVIGFTYAYNIQAESILYITESTLRIDVLAKNQWSNLKYFLAILEGKDLHDIISTGNFKKGIVHPECLVVSYSMLVTNTELRKYVASRSWGIIIADESHNISATSKRGCICMALMNNCENVVKLTGTPIVNSAADLFPALYTIVPELDYVTVTEHNDCLDYERFAHKYTNVIPTKKYGNLYKGVRNHFELTQLLKGYDFFYRKTKAQVLPELPDKSIYRVQLGVNVTVTGLPPKKIQKIIKDSSDDSSKLGKNPILASLRKDLGIAKAHNKDFIKYTKNLLDSGEPVVLFAWHTEVIDTLMKQFKEYKPLRITGNTPMKERQGAINKFQDGKRDLIILNLASGGKGITLTASSNVVFLEHPWTYAAFEQCSDRVHRIGQKNAVNLHLMISKNPLDQVILDIIEKKKETSEKVLA